MEHGERLIAAFSIRTARVGHVGRQTHIDPRRSCRAGTQPPLADNSLSLAKALRMSACLRERRTRGLSFEYFTTRYSTYRHVIKMASVPGGEAVWGRTSSPHSRASLSLCFALFHISSSCCQPISSARHLTCCSAVNQLTLIPHCRTRCACFLASGQSRAVPSALQVACQYGVMADSWVRACVLVQQRRHYQDFTHSRPMVPQASVRASLQNRRLLSCRQFPASISKRFGPWLMLNKPRKRLLSLSLPVGSEADLGKQR
jgi:hypothetical protein